MRWIPIGPLDRLCCSVVVADVTHELAREIAHGSEDELGARRRREAPVNGAARAVPAAPGEPVGSSVQACGRAARVTFDFNVTGH